MRLLLDTHIYIWTVSGDKRLKLHARKTIQEAEVVYVSAVSIWEASIKFALGKLEASAADLASEITRVGFSELPLLARHSIALSALPLIHKDPFDRILVAQANAESLRLMTADRTLGKYSSLALQV